MHDNYVSLKRINTNGKHGLSDIELSLHLSRKLKADAEILLMQVPQPRYHSENLGFSPLDSNGVSSLWLKLIHLFIFYMAKFG